MPHAVTELPQVETTPVNNVAALRTVFERLPDHEPAGSGPPMVSGLTAAVLRFTGCARVPVAEAFLKELGRLAFPSADLPVELTVPVDSLLLSAADLADVVRNIRHSIERGPPGQEPEGFLGRRVFLQPFPINATSDVHFHLHLSTQHLPLSSPSTYSSTVSGPGTLVGATVNVELPSITLIRQLIIYHAECMKPRQEQNIPCLARASLSLFTVVGGANLYSYVQKNLPSQEPGCRMLKLQLEDVDRAVSLLLTQDAYNALAREVMQFLDPYHAGLAADHYLEHYHGQGPDPRLVERYTVRYDGIFGHLKTLLQRPYPLQPLMTRLIPALGPRTENSLAKSFIPQARKSRAAGVAVLRSM